MKKLFLAFTMFSFISFGLISCGDDETPADPCANVTCQNGGTCVDGACDCPDGFTGTSCETVVPTCDVCDTYTGTVSSDGDSIDLLIGGSTGLDNEPLDPTPFTAVVTPDANSDSLVMAVTLEVDPLGTGTDIPVNLSVNVAYNETTGAFEAAQNKDYELSVLSFNVQARLVSLNGTFTNNNQVDGTMVLGTTPGSSDVVDGTLVFTATK